MTEKEKMLQGLLYYADADMELEAERGRAKDLCHQFNQLQPSDLEAHRRLLRCLFGKTGECFTVVAPFWCDYGYNIEVGEIFFANHNMVILDCAKVIFGDNVFVGPDCGFYTAAHPLAAEERRQGLEYAKPIIVGDDVWIGGGVRVLPGVHIGSNTVIGSGSVVTKDIPANCLAAGNPCRVLRPITEADKMIK